MLPPKNRLKKKKDFEKVLKEGKGFTEDFLFLKIIKNNFEISRVGFIVGKKISKKASQRNKIKRRLREIIRLCLGKIQPGFDLVFLAKPGIEKRDFWELEEMMHKILKKGKILKINH